jgi:hypothetical protein
LKPVTLTLPLPVPKSSQAAAAAADIEEEEEEDPSCYFRYRYVVHRAGVFYRMEQPSDAAGVIHAMEDQEEDDQEDCNQMQVEEPSSSSSPPPPPSSTDTSSTATPFHQIPLRLLSHRESYVINDVLGKVGGHPDIDHITVPNTQVVGSSHKRQPSMGRMGSSTSSATATTTADASTTATTTTTTSERKKAVGFAPAPPTYHVHPPTTTNTTTSATTKDEPSTPSKKTPHSVHLNSTDGLVVVSAFLPVVLHRSDAGQWTADWDYEALLSMQTHLRVTRIGVVKWRGWHGNFGNFGTTTASTSTSSSTSTTSIHSGVPVPERHLVEECLRPFHCVPVWIDTAVFGEM